MSSSIFSLHGHSICTRKNRCISVSFVTHTLTHHRISILVEPLTGRQPPLIINLTLNPILPFAYFSFWVDSSLVTTVVLDKSLLPHICQIRFVSPLNRHIHVGTMQVIHIPQTISSYSLDHMLFPYPETSQIFNHCLFQHLN